MLVSQVPRTSERDWASYTTSAPKIKVTLAMRQYDCSNASHRFAATYVEAAGGTSLVAFCCKSFRSETLSKSTACMPSREQQQNRAHRVSRWVRVFRTLRSCWPEQSLRSSGKADKLNPHSRTQCFCSQRSLPYFKFYAECHADTP